ncbi:glycoside hydrolase family 5 protein [Suillus fuscotomentosus]|uniref:mannan endo-1,4-beta-mannosidase n=1 Tax=Suillus fuscotomentosus TaxID=1912939 RepID=A0AAD4HPU6_9AGAM|nr:glycoside hydrolase family 5 protein [Suillus fuscotomentosus]KAG1905655.1 glycoside hydrolase family 5 protein [Suillus fuscotomentosus]
MNFLPWGTLFFSILWASVVSAIPSRTIDTRASSPFVSTSGSGFVVNGSSLKYIGTNVYWLPTLNTNEDIRNTLANISALGIKVVRLWAFNDVDTIPVNGTWLQLIQNGTVTVNNGPNGLQKLDTVIQLAEEQGLYTLDPCIFLIMTLGGMDTYVRQFGLQTHDEFYTNPSVLTSFLNYTTQVVSRYVNSPSVFSYELANDARCNSTLPASATCTTETITAWHATVAAHIRSIDPNHLISSGVGGYLCPDCTKLYPLTAPAPPVTSPAPGKKKRSQAKPVTKKQILREQSERRRRNREVAKRAGTLVEDGVRVRGRWVSTATKRQQSSTSGSLYDGSYGVDSQDISNIPDIGFSSFQLFPDQQSYGPDDPNVPSWQSIEQNGAQWITTQAQSAAAVGKPAVLTAFGLVTQANAPDFVPFNSTVAPFASENLAKRQSTLGYGVTDQQQATTYTTWLDTGIASGLNGIVQYQWGQSGLTAEPGTTISPSTTTGESPTPSSPGETPTPQQTTGESPNDGYAMFVVQSFYSDMY